MRGWRGDSDRSQHRARPLPVAGVGVCARSNTRPASAIVKGFVGMLVVACAAAALMALSVTQWWSWHLLSDSGGYVERTATTGWIEDEGAWQRYQKSLRMEESLAPFDARVYWQSGELAYWQAAGLRLWPDRQREAFETARQRYLRAVVRTPSNGVLLARVALRLARTDEPRAVALMRRAMDVAPFEPLVEYYLADVGLQLFDHLDESMRQPFRQMLAHAMNNYQLAPRVKKLANQYGHSELLSHLGSAPVD